MNRARLAPFILGVLCLFTAGAAHDFALGTADETAEQSPRWAIAPAVHVPSWSVSEALHAPAVVMPIAATARASANKRTQSGPTKSKKALVSGDDMGGLKASDTPGLAAQAIGLSILAVVPFVLMLVTPFAKFAMVFSLLRNALGVQQVPPNQVVNGVSIILSLFVMFPVGLQMYEQASVFMAEQHPPALASQDMPKYILQIFERCKEPMRDFLRKNTDDTHIKNFYKIAFRMSTEERYQKLIATEDFIVLVPAYITTQVKRGFEIGTLIFLPFFVVDLVVSNILLAMGMMMLSPVTISMPLKIFLLVMLDGWTLLTEGLIASYK